VAEVTGTQAPAPGPDEPGPFSLSDPARVRAVLGAAGFSAIAVTPHADYLVIPEDRIPEVAATGARGPGGRQALREASDETRQRALAAIQTAFRARLHDGQVRISRAVLLVTGTA
jgi:hypothetical protein